MSELWNGWPDSDDAPSRVKLHGRTRSGEGLTARDALRLVLAFLVVLALMLLSAWVEKHQANDVASDRRAVDSPCRGVRQSQRTPLFFSGLQGGGRRGTVGRFASFL